METHLTELTYGHLVLVQNDCSINVPEDVGIHHSYLNHTIFCYGHSCDLTLQRDFVSSLTEDIEVRLCQDQHRDQDREGIYISHHLDQT